MAEVSGLDMVREIIGQINNLRRLVTINGKKYKWDGKKYVRAVDGKTFTKKELVSYVKDEKFEAPKTPKSSKSSEELKTTKITKDSKGRRVVDPEGTKLKIKKQEKFETKAKNKLKSIKTNLKGEVNKTVGQGKNIFNNLKMKVSKPNAFSYEDTNKANAPTRSNKLANMLKMNKAIGAQTPKGGAVRGAIGSIGTAVANPLVDQVVDRLFRNISGNQKMSLKDYRTMMQQRRDNWPSVLQRKALLRKAEQPLQIRNRRGRVIETVAPPEDTVIGRRNEQYIDRTQSTPTPKKKTTSTNYVQTPSPTWGVGDKPKDKVKSTKVVNKKKKTAALKVNKQLERRKKAIKRAYGNISDKRMKQLLSRAVTQRELEES